MKIKALGYVAIEATDVTLWRDFLENTVGVMLAPSMPVSSDSSGDLYFKIDEYSWRIRVFSGEKNCLAIAGWEVKDKKDFDAALQELTEKNVSFKRLTKSQCQERRIQEAVTFLDPAGNVIELFYAMALDYHRLVSKVGISCFETGFNGDMGLGHFVLPVKCLEQCHDFYINVMGFGQTDYMHFYFDPNDPDGQGLHFLHVDNPRHHSLALYQDPNPPEHNCVHLMLEVKNIDEVGYFIDRCRAADVKIVSSLGRHTNDLMMSVYVKTPAGFALEFGCDGLQLDWENYTPTHSSVPSLWGHNWQ